MLNDLEADPRHTDLVVLFDESGGDARWFAGWGMKHLITFGGTPAMEELRSLLAGTDEGRRVLVLVEESIAR